MYDIRDLKTRSVNGGGGASIVYHSATSVNVGLCSVI